MKLSYRLALVFMVLSLAACSHVPEATYKAALPMPDEARPAPIILSMVHYELPTGTEVGGVGQGWCLLKQPVGRRELGRTLVEKDLKDTFHDTMHEEGYDTTGNPDLMFDEEIEADELRAEYRVGAEIIDARTDLCATTSGGAFNLTPSPGIEGKLYLKIRWHVYDALRRASVYKTETEGYASRALPNPEGVDLLMNDAFAMAVHNLGAEPAFHDLIVYGTKPARADADPLPKERPRQFDATAPVTLKRLPLSARPFPDHAEMARHAAVLVQDSLGHGSGFFIDRDGDILTNAHVVGAALHVRVVLADRGQAMIGEVVRVDPARDVALVRLTEPPPAPPIILPIRSEWPGVGEKVYAIGAPETPRMQDSVTAGIISAWRKDMPFLGTREDFLQSDVSIQPGNSGGPLLDADGNIVALTVGGFQPLQVSAGLNYFIPIGEALKALNVRVQ